jgi:hypothetical protein
MAIPWLRVIDAVIGVTDIARSRRIGKLREENDSRALETRAPSAALGGLETRLAGVVVAALKEAFDRDRHRLDLERERMEADRRRAERALRLELARQAGYREIGRLRLIAGIAVATWIGTLFFVGRLGSAAVGARFTFAVGWMLLLAAIAVSFSAQSRIGQELGRIASAPESDRLDVPPSPGAGNAALWLLVAALGIIGFVAVAI